jgi:ubiquinone/menaquinone biosynthesis C-methylase UbiE
VIEYDRIAADYSASRDLPPAALEGWREALQMYLPSPTGLPLLDLGAGTGTFTRAFVTWFSVEVIAVEPSEGMRREMLARGLPPGAACFTRRPRSCHFPSIAVGLRGSPL